MFTAAFEVRYIIEPGEVRLPIDPMPLVTVMALPWAAETLDEGVEHADRAENVDVEGARPFGIADGARRVVELADDAGGVEKEVERSGAFAGHGLDRGDVGDIHRDRPHAAAEAAQIVGHGFGMAAGGDHLPAIRGILADEFPAEPSAGARDEYGGHRHILLQGAEAPT